MKTKPIFAITALACALIACSKESTEPSTSEITPDPTLGKYFTTAKIPAGKPISVIRENVEPGDEISLSGLVMGREKVFVDGRASFLLGDPTTLTPCNAMPDDECETPWDVCCDSNEVKKAGIASIQIVGEDGRVLSGEIRGIDGLKELSSVTVSGIVAPQSTPDALIVNAAKIYVTKP